jgi:hypothetical protein
VRLARALALLLLALPAAARDEGTLPLEARVPAMDTASAQLAHARRLKACMRGRAERDREFWRELAIEAYRAVPAYHAADQPVCAEAAFRAAELLRAAGRLPEALEELRCAVRWGRGTEFHARGLLEIGHVERRMGHARRALDAYLDVAADSSASAARRDDAWLWAGRVWKDEDRIEDARRAWRGVAREGEDPVDRILAYDYLALLHVELDERDAAAAVVIACRRELADVAIEETRQGERVRKALLRMRALELLHREERAGGETDLKKAGEKTEKALTR